MNVLSLQNSEKLDRQNNPDYKWTGALKLNFLSLSLFLQKIIHCIIHIFNEICQEFDCKAEDLKDLGELGHGAYGVVQKMKLESNETMMAVKVDILLFVVLFMQLCSLIGYGWGWQPRVPWF